MTVAEKVYPAAVLRPEFKNLSHLADLCRTHGAKAQEYGDCSMVVHEVLVCARRPLLFLRPWV